MTGDTLVWSPLVPWAALAALGAVGVIFLAYGAFRRAGGVVLRTVSLGILLLSLAGPVLVQEQRAPQKDVALIVKDVSLSQKLGDRGAHADAAVKALQDRLAHSPDLELRTITAGEAAPGSGDQGTQLFGAAVRALADVPPARVAGVVMVTDGQVNDVPPTTSPPFTAPLHVLLDGERHEGDRRLVIKQAPTFGIVGNDVQMTLQVEDVGENGAEPDQGEMAQVTIRRDGGAEQVANLPVGTDTTMQMTLDHGGPTIFEISVEPGKHELTLDNNRAAIVVNGVRDRLKVLLVSGEPHAGERAWRNLLKADPSVDLVHFTILRPPDKQDHTPIRELSLIAFPIHELFDEKLDQFDLVIFDRYQRRGVLPMNYLDNVARFVRNGGALLEASGTSEGTVGSLYQTPLGSVLPAEPTGEILEEGFKPKLTDLGQRHPVTADLPGAPASSDAEPGWGRWFRQAEATAHRGVTLLNGSQGKPLLVLDRVGQGRVAQILSDQMWLWTRGFEGGGPQAELLRRLAYWLMKEPDLEENDLRGKVDGDRLTITRRSLARDDSPVELTRPDGTKESLPLSEQPDGKEVAVVPATQSGLYRLSDGTHSVLAAVGALNPIELSDVRTTPDKLAPLVTATGGGIAWVGNDGAMPDIRRVRPGEPAAGTGWIGFRANGDYIVTGVSQTELLPPWLALLLALGTLIAAWRREGR